ncbi:hypothetical protein V9K67_22315 [Paraflavisolibacter sp. H34]|uniref:hypothetical protein n=1 Tax=Huijunlia imazamoxiresistens TaxID=3127457 RepID=UPI003018E654
MAYITVSNSKKLIKKLDEFTLDSVAEKIYKRDIYFLSRRESANLKGIRELFKDLEKFITEYYQPIVVKDTYRYVFPENQPAYHRDNTCDRLHSNFRNIEVPSIIREKGVEEVIKFRTWYNNTQFNFDDPKDYIFKLQLKFPYVGVIVPQTIDYSNSGAELKKDYSLAELECEIDGLLLECDNYFNDNPNLRDLIYRYQKWTFLAFVDGEIKNNRSGLKDEQLKSFLKAYELKFKTPVKERLVEYYRVKYNPNMEFKGTLLEQLGFKPCGTCLH